MDKKLGIAIGSGVNITMVFQGKNQGIILKELQNEKYFDKEISLWYNNGMNWQEIE